MDCSNESSSVGSSSTESNYDLEDSGEDFNGEGDVNIQPYAFEPVEETDSDDDVEEEMGEDESFQILKMPQADLRTQTGNYTV